jgi:hypothetical protein
MSLDYWKHRFQTANPNQYHQFKNKTPEKKDQMATAALYKARQPNNENFADGRHPEDKGDSKRYGINTKASVSSLRKTAKQGGRKGQLAHWLANMKAGRAKKK